jgi:hypothetical protein
MYVCPAVKSSIKNVFVIKSNIDDDIDLPIDFLNRFYEESVNPNVSYPFVVPTNSSISVLVRRPPSFEGYLNLNYNMAWTFFADEPVTAKFTAPYFPPQSPAPGAMLATGEFDIGSWYRRFETDYHVPLNTTRLTFKQNDPLFYLELKTDKSIIFKRYTLSNRLRSLQEEMSNSSVRYGRFKSLEERYKQARYAKISQQVLTEIKNNVIED